MGTKISALTDGTTAVATDRIPIARSPFGATDNRYITPAYIKDYILGLPNTFTAKQTLTPPANTEALAVSGYSLTGSNAQSLMDLAGTWNTTGTPTALKLNITDTASNAASKLMDLQVGGATKYSVYKSGVTEHQLGSATAPSIIPTGVTNSGIYWTTTTNLSVTVSGVERYRFGSGGQFSSTGGFAMATTIGANSVVITFDAAETYAQRNGTAAQITRGYRTFTDASNYERWALQSGAGYFELAAETAGTGTDNIDLRLTPAGTGGVTSAFSIKSTSATAGVGYATGAGGTVTQATSKSTGVTLNTVCGEITMDGAALAGDTTVSFTLTNSAIAATDRIIVNHESGGTAGSYLLNAQAAAGSATINVRNITTGSLSEAIVIGFTVIKSVTS